MQTVCGAPVRSRGRGVTVNVVAPGPIRTDMFYDVVEQGSDKERQLDDEMRKIEQALRSREDVDWKKNNPETQARADGMSRQLLDAIEKLEADLAAAEKAGNAKAVKQAQEALDARRAWLKALGA